MYSITLGFIRVGLPWEVTKDRDLRRYYDEVLAMCLCSLKQNIETVSCLCCRHSRARGSRAANSCQVCSCNQVRKTKLSLVCKYRRIDFRGVRFSAPQILQIMGVLLSLSSHLIFTWPSLIFSLVFRCVSFSGQSGGVDPVNTVRIKKMVARSTHSACRLVLNGARIDAGKSHGLITLLYSNEAYSLTRNYQK